MNRFVHADADRASSRTRALRRERDIDFLGELRELVERGDLDRLWRLAAGAIYAPTWRRLAIARAIYKVRAAHGERDIR